MKLTRTVRYNSALFGLAPFVNVIFLVMIFFALSSRYVLQPGIAVTLPLASFTLAPQRNPQILSITAGPAPVIFFQDQKLAPGDVARALGATHGKDRTLIVRADRSTPYDLIMSVTNQALQAGYPVVLATSPDQK